MAGALASALLAVAAAACGGPAADLFGVIRSGTVPGANIKIVPSSDGTVQCGSKTRELTSKLLLKAANFDFNYQSTKHLRLPSGPNPVYTYVVTTEAGTFSFSDDSPHLGPELKALAAWTYTVAKTICA